VVDGAGPATCQFSDSAAPPTAPLTLSPSHPCLARLPAACFCCTPPPRPHFTIWMDADILFTGRQLFYHYLAVGRGFALPRHGPGCSTVILPTTLPVRAFVLSLCILRTTTPWAQWYPTKRTPPTKTTRVATFPVLSRCPFLLRHCAHCLHFSYTTATYTTHLLALPPFLMPHMPWGGKKKKKKNVHTAPVCTHARLRYAAPLPHIHICICVVCGYTTGCTRFAHAHTVHAHFTRIRYAFTFYGCHFAFVYLRLRLRLRYALYVWTHLPRLVLAHPTFYALPRRLRLRGCVYVAHARCYTTLHAVAFRLFRFTLPHVLVTRTFTLRGCCYRTPHAVCYVTTRVAAPRTLRLPHVMRLWIARC